MTTHFADTLCTIVWTGIIAVIVYFAYAVNLVPAVWHLLRTLGL